MHDASARPLWSSRERAAAVIHMTHTPMVSSKPDDKMTKSEGTSTRSRVPGLDDWRIGPHAAGRFKVVGTLSDGEPRTRLV
jgi:hypothetical protein